jgi:hypothetical protein
MLSEQRNREQSSSSLGQPPMGLTIAPFPGLAQLLRPLLEMTLPNPWLLTGFKIIKWDEQCSFLLVSHMILKEICNM